MKITVLLDHDPVYTGDDLSLQLVETLAQAGHDVECLIATDEPQDSVSRLGVKYRTIPFANAYPAMYHAEPDVVLSAGEMAPHACRMAGYLDVPSVLAVADDSPTSTEIVNCGADLLVYPSEFLRQTLPSAKVSSVVVRAEGELADEVLRKELEAFVTAVQTTLDGFEKTEEPVGGPASSPS